MSNENPQRLGDYEIMKVLGAGGMGRVYQVRNVITDRIEAMKVLLPEISGQEQVAARFLREIKVLAALNHPNIARLHTALTIDNQLVMIMEYVEGQSISSQLALGAIPVPDALTYIDQVLDALAYAHQSHVIHRDIKPANMMLTPAGLVKLMDFGIARTDDEASSLTAPGSTLGSTNYMSPEQVKGEATDERSDLYSLGISLYEMVTGDRPFHGDSSFSLMAAHVNQPPTPPIDLLPDMPPGLNDIILTSIAKEPAQRFQSAGAFRNAVKVVLRELQEGKTMIQGSQDSTGTGSRTPLPHVRTGPITRPRPTAPTAPSAAAPVVAVPAVSHTAPTAPTMKPSAPAAAAPAAATVVMPPPAMPAAQPVAQAAVPPAGNRGLWVAFGAIAVLIVLVAAALYIPRSRKASAADDGRITNSAPPANTVPASTQPPPTTASQPAPTTPPAETPAPVTPAPSNTAAVPNKAAAANKLAADHAASAAAAQQAAADQQAAAAKAKELDAIEHDVDQLTARAASVNASIDTLQRQQAASGLGLRGDIAAKVGSMRMNLSKAQDAITRGDAERAKRYAALATSDIEALESFLGR